MIQEINKGYCSAGLIFSYMDSDKEIKNVNFEFKKGEVILLTRNSCCRKLILFKCLIGLIQLLLTDTFLESFR